MAGKRIQCDCDPECPDCERRRRARERKRRYRAENPERARQNDRDHYARHRDQILARQRAYLKDPVKWARHRAACRRWNASNAQAVSEYQKAYHAVWRAKNKEAIAERERAYYLRRKAERDGD